MEIENEIGSDRNDFYECSVCKLKYKDSKWADKCAAWCEEHNSCNLDIIEHATK